MKNKPNQDLLSKWMAGELEGDQLAQVEAWADANPSEAESEAGKFSLELSSVIPAEVEPPYPEFFNSKLQHEIEELERTAATPVKPTGISLMQKLRWLFAPAAAGAMALCFYAGTKVATPATSTGTTPVAEVSKEAEIYVPNGGVTAAVFDSQEAEVIVLDGLEPIPDSLDIVSAPAPEKSIRMISAEERASDDWL